MACDQWPVAGDQNTLATCLDKLIVGPGQFLVSLKERRSTTAARTASTRPGINSPDLKPLVGAPKDEFSGFVRMQPEHVDIAGALGLGVSNRGKIDLREYHLA